MPPSLAFMSLALLIDAEPDVEAIHAGLVSAIRAAATSLAIRASDEERMARLQKLYKNYLCTAMEEISDGGLQAARVGEVEMGA
ncbi:hypothetical protein GCM10009038_11530 [Salinicola rhizosphaerae]|uniref:Uncharacterized protein n=1 Tax=Salinicola rhizosphaerae TaxID=1443141 RepID=A0ABQ3DU40_9GAMM|nr:hypothetical protein GCM10009038_11530 [Salinicola rhizosphaerae]